MRPIPIDYLHATKPSDFLSFTTTSSLASPARADAVDGGIGAPTGHQGPPKP
jgi:hypothetical protein